MTTKIFRYVSITALMILAVAAVSFKSAQAATITVPTGSDPLVNGDNFQTALNNAQCGDTIVLQAGAHYGTRVAFISSGGPQGYPFSLPNKSCTSGQYVTIQTSQAANLPAGRINPSNIGLMATLETNSSSWVIEPAQGAGWYKFIGIEFMNTANVPNNNGGVPVLIAAPAGGYYAYGGWPHDMVYDRVWIHPYEETGNPSSNCRSAFMGINMDGQNMVLKNSYISGFMGFQCNALTTPAQSTGVLFLVGDSITISNNFIEAWYSNIFSGGGGGMSGNNATLTNVSMSGTGIGATITATFSQVVNLDVGDLVAFQTAAYPNTYGFSTTWMTGKVTSLSGTVVTLTQYQSISPSPPSAPGTAKWDGVNPTNITVTNNTLNKRNEWATGGFGIAKSYWEMKTGVNVLIDGNIFLGPGGNIMGPLSANQTGDAPWSIVSNVTISNNLMNAAGNLNINLAGNYYNNPSAPGGPLTFTNNLLTARAIRSDLLIFGAGSPNVSFTHNTFRSNTRTIVAADANPVTPGFKFQDNIVNSGYYWIQGTYSDLVKSRNIIVNNSGSTGAPPGYSTDFVVPSDSSVGFANVSSADAGGDYHGYALASNSAYKGQASDGKDPGVDFVALDAALAGGSYTPPPPPTSPLPPPDTTPPSTPTNLSATVVSSSQINLSWSFSTDNIGVTGYKIYRGGTHIAIVTTISYSDTGLSTSTTYSYTVSAYDLTGNTSPQSSPVSATTLSVTTTLPPTIKFQIGDRVQVTTRKLNVRLVPAGRNIGFHRLGDQGSVMAGPTLANGYSWYNINYDTNPDGWSVENYLAKMITADAKIQQLSSELSTVSDQLSKARLAPQENLASVLIIIQEILNLIRMKIAGLR